MLNVKRKVGLKTWGGASTWLCGKVKELAYQHLEKQNPKTTGLIVKELKSKTDQKEKDGKTCRVRMFVLISVPD